MRLRDLPSHAKVDVCRHIADGDRPINGVSYGGGFITAICLVEDHDCDDRRQITLGELLAREEITGVDLSPGEEAFFEGGEWQYGKTVDRWRRERGSWL